MKRVLPNRKIVNRDIDEKQIKKNNDVDIEYNIKRIKKERRYTFILVVFFIILILCILYAIFSRVQNQVDMNKLSTDNLSITYETDLNGIKDTINIRSKNSTYNTRFTISNNSNNKVKYAIYLVDDKDLINLEGCSNKIIDYNYLYYSINFSDSVSLSSVKKKNKYIIDSGKILKNTSKEFRLSLSYDKNISRDYHYHGRIIVEELD